MSQVFLPGCRLFLLLSWGRNYFLGPLEVFLQYHEWPPGGNLRAAILSLWFPVLIIRDLFFALFKRTRFWDRHASPFVRLLVSLFFVACPATAALPGPRPEPEIFVPGQSQSKLRARLWGSGLHAAKKLSLAVSSRGLRHVSADDFVHCRERKRERDDVVLVSGISPR